MISLIQDIKPFYALRKQIKLELSKLVNSTKGENEFKSALRILNEIDNRKVIDIKISTLANQIFFNDDSQVYSEQYKDFLKKMHLETSYFEVPRMLENEQYEQAALLAISSFMSLSKIPKLDVGKLASSLRFFNILQTASERNDTVIILQLVDILSNNHLLNEQNYANLLATSLANMNGEVAATLFRHVKDFNLTDATWKCFADLLIGQNQTEQVVEIISKVKSEDVKNMICLNLLASFEFKEFCTLLDTLVTDNTMTLPSIDMLPPALLSLPNLDDYTELAEMLSVIGNLKSEQVKMFIIFAILKSIDNGSGHLGSIIFLLNGLYLDRNLLTESHKNIIFHNTSNQPFKLTGLKLLDFFKSMKLTITEENYLHLLISQCYGVEFDTLFFVLVQVLTEYNDISSEMRELLKQLQKQTNDSRLQLFLEADLKSKSLETLKSEVNYEFIKKNLEYERERNKVDHEIIEGLSKYNYHNDLKLVDSLKM